MKFGHPVQDFLRGRAGCNPFVSRRHACHYSGSSKQRPEDFPSALILWGEFLELFDSAVSDAVPLARLGLRYQ